jgi:hypothetical protein
MPLPGTIQYITVHGVFQDSGGNPSSGSITFAPPPVLVDPGSSVIYSRAVSANLDSTGAFSVVLVCTDNPELVPVGWAYTVTERIAGTAGRTYQVFLPHTLGSTVDFSTVTPIPSVTGVPAIIPSGVVAPGYGGLAYTQTWSGTNTFTGPVVFTGAVTGVSVVGGITVSGTPVAGYVLTATSASAANWQASTGGGGSGVQIGGDLGGTNSVPTVTGTHLAAPLPLAQGGTGQATAQAALTALAGTQTAGRYLRSDGTNTALSAIQAADVPVLNQNTTGTASNITGVAAIANGGTGAANAAAARTALGLGTAATANIDATPTDIAALGTQAAGATGQVADAGHVHQMPRLDQIGAPTADVSLGNHKITALLAGVSSTDAVNVGQLPVVPGAASTVVSETGYGQAAAVGADTTYAREDHTHGSPSLTSTAPATVLGIAQSGAVGTAGTPARADHVHPLAAAAAPTASAVGDTSATGVAATFAASDHKHAREAFGAATAQTTYGQSSATGSATTISHSDHTHGTPALTTTAPATTLAIGTAAALGVATLPALADHVHPMSAAAAPGASAVGDTVSTGASTSFAAADHRHAREAFGGAPATTLGVGQAAAAGTATTPSRSDHVHPTAAAAAPTASAVGDASVTGTSTSPAAADHKHAREAFGSAVAATVFAAASVNGSATTLARSDHVHGLPDAYSFDTPKQRGWSEWNYPPMLSVAVSQNLTSGTIYGLSFVAQSNNAITKVGVQVVSSASTPTAGQNLVGLYTISGTTATQATVTADLGTWSSAGFQSYAFGAGQTLIAGNTYLLLIMSNATTPVHLQGITSDTSAQIGFLNLGLSNTAAPWFKFFVNGTVQTALPASFAISGTTMTGTNALAPWACLL